jgi:uncharacterized membrane protein YfcA
MDDWWLYPLLFGGGLLAGLMNTLAGNGSAITLSILILSGMPANVANGTNRIGALVQTITAVLSLRKSPRTLFLFRDSIWFVIPAVIGSLIGAFLAVDVDPLVLKKIIGFIMLLLLVTMIYKPSKWARATDVSKNHKSFLNWILVFSVAIYGGFLQMGIGIMVLTLLVLVAHYSLRDANIIKLVLALLFVVPAFLVFMFRGDMEWLPGIALAFGQGLGGWIGARYILFLPKANQIVRYTLIVILSISSVTLLGLWDYIKTIL